MKRNIRTRIGLSMTLASGLWLCGCGDGETARAGGQTAVTPASAGSGNEAGSGNASGAGGVPSSTTTAPQAGAASNGSSGAGGEVSAESGASLRDFVQLVPQMFQLNQQRQQERYYMAEFEFKMLGLIYYLDHDQPETALARGQELYTQLVTTEGLIRVPLFDSVREEYEFYRDRQNPVTGAFMDDAYPLCTYTGPTENVLIHLEELAEELDEPLSLKYPLTYLDEIADPDALVELLDSLATISEELAGFPQTPYLMARELLSLHSYQTVISAHDLYSFTDEWRTTMLTWFYNNQDAETGFWGPRSRRTGKLLKLDVSDTANILKWFMDDSGNELYEEFPIRHREEIFDSAIGVMSQPLPDADETALWHEWSLVMMKGTDLLTRYLWSGASVDDKVAARDIFRSHLETRFERHYVSEQEAFSYYPDAEFATMDGAGAALSAYASVGALSLERQNVLWDTPLETAENLGVISANSITSESIAPIEACEEVSSVRFYAGDHVEDPNADVVAVYYPHTPKVLDAADAIPKLKAWLASTDQTMGNWVSKASLDSELADVELEKTTVSETLPVEVLDSALESSGAVTALGLDELQMPKCRLTLITITEAAGS